MAKLKFKRLYKGGYEVMVSGLKVNIDRQYESKTWVAQSFNGDIDMETDHLDSIRCRLQRLNDAGVTSEREL
jgi:hypothetical protein